MAVKRYDWGEDGMYECEDGDYVSRDDYQRDIKAKDAEIERVTTKLSKVIENRGTIIQQLTDEIERLKARELEIAERAFNEGYALNRVYASAPQAWLYSDIRKELTND